MMMMMMMMNDISGSSGDDRGLIRVVGQPTRRTNAAFINAIRDFAHLGITISSFYPDNCEDIQ